MSKKNSKKQDRKYSAFLQRQEKERIEKAKLMQERKKAKEAARA